MFANLAPGTRVLAHADGVDYGIVIGPVASCDVPTVWVAWAETNCTEPAIGWAEAADLQADPRYLRTA